MLGPPNPVIPAVFAGRHPSPPPAPGRATACERDPSWATPRVPGLPRWRPPAASPTVGSGAGRTQRSPGTALVERSDPLESLRGKLLVSSGGLYDPNFRHTVVLVGEHNAEGALGVVLNRALDLTVREAIPPLGDLVPTGEHLFQGGPVQPTSPVLLAELRRVELADLPVFGSIGFLVGELSEDIEPEIVRARVYAGYSGWGPGQLEAEMAADSWIVESASGDDVFTDAPDLLWSRVLERKGPEYRRLSRMPYDPSMN